MFLQYLKDLLSFIESLQMKDLDGLNPLSQENNELKLLNLKYAQLQKEQTETLRQLEGEIGAAGIKTNL